MNSVKKRVIVVLLVVVTSLGMALPALANGLIAGG